MGEVPRCRDMGPLHTRLLTACPPDGEGHVSIIILASHLGISTSSIYKWVHAGRVPAERVPELLDIQRKAFGRPRVPAHELNPVFLP